MGKRASLVSHWSSQGLTKKLRPNRELLTEDKSKIWNIENVEMIMFQRQSQSKVPVVNNSVAATKMQLLYRINPNHRNKDAAGN